MWSGASEGLLGQCAICGQAPVSFRSCVGISNLSLTTKVLLCVAELGQKLILRKYANGTCVVHITFHNAFCLKGAGELFYSA